MYLLYASHEVLNFENKLCHMSFSSFIYTVFLMFFYSIILYLVFVDFIKSSS